MFDSNIIAINPDGTKRWTYTTPQIGTSITIANGGMLYYGHWQGLDARYPNGTLQWTFRCGGVQSTPAVDTQGFIYFGGIDSSTIYALYPNGTLKWSYPTGAWVHGSPTIAPNGIIYCGSDDNYLYAFNPNGTLIWKTDIGSGMRSSPSLDKQGNLYFGLYNGKITSIAPNGIIRWVYNITEGGSIWGSTAAISDDGTLYIGNLFHNLTVAAAGEIIALTLNGTLKWRKVLCDSDMHSSPVIASDGTVYICGSNDGLGPAWGYLFAFGPVDNDQPPERPVIAGLTKVKNLQFTTFTFQSNDSDNTPVYYIIDWGDKDNHDQSETSQPGVPCPAYHVWKHIGFYTIRAKAVDTYSLESDWATYKVWVQSPHYIIHWLLDRFPNAFPLLRLLFGDDAHATLLTS